VFLARSRNVKGTISACFSSRFANVVAFQMHHNHLKGLPKEINNLRCLPSNFSIHPLIFMLECRSLEVLDLSYNYLDALPSELFDLSSLSLLLVGYNRFSEVSEERIGRLTNLTRLELQGNRLTAPPPQVWKLWRLQSLVLSGNAISSLNFPSNEGGGEEERVRESVVGKEKGADGDPFKCTCASLFLSFSLSSLSFSLSLSLSHTPHTHTHT